MGVGVGEAFAVFLSHSIYIIVIIYITIYSVGFKIARDFPVHSRRNAQDRLNKQIKVHDTGQLIAQIFDLTIELTNFNVHLDSVHVHVS